MGMNPEEKIRSAEIEYKQFLEDYFTATWGETVWEGEASNTLKYSGGSSYF
jgi:hypothetical protein